MTAVFFYIRLCKLYNKRVFKACEVRETAAYYGVCEDSENERNAENTLLDSFFYQ